LQQVPLDPDVKGLRRLNCLAYDSQRKRLVFPSRDRKPDLFALDVEKVQWSRLGASQSRLGALAYDAQNDVFYGVPLLDQYRFRHGHEQSVRHLERIKADGSGAERLELSEPILPFWGDHGGIQLRLVDGKLVIVVPPVFEADGRTVSRLYVINPTNGSVEYSGVARVHDGNGKSQQKATSVPNGILAEFDRKVGDVNNAIVALKQKNLKEPADSLVKGLEDIQAVVRGIAEDELTLDPELHMLGTHSGDGVRVHVTQTNRPVVLALTSYNLATWKLQIAPDVQLVKVIAAGYHRQKVEGVPDGIPVETYSSDERNGGFDIDEEDDPELPRAINRLRELTKLELSTFLVTREHGSVEVGPGNFAWQLKRGLARLDGLLDKAGEHIVTGRDAEIADLRFTGLWSEQQPDPRVPQIRRQGDVYLAEFTARGPIFSTMRKLITRVPRVATSTDGTHVFALAGNGLTRINPKTGGTSNIPLGEKMPPFSHTRDLAFDSRRGRVLVATLGGEGFLYAYDVEKKTWSASSLGGLDLDGLAWSPDQDALFGLMRDHGDERPKLVRLTAHGVALESIRLERAIPELAQHRGSAQLHAAGKYLILQASPDWHDPRSTAQTGLYVIDPKDGSFLHSGVAEPHAGHEDFTPQQLTELWQQLREARDDDADRLTWRLAAGGEQTVRFLSDVVLPAGMDFDQDAAQELIEQLADVDFKKRENAQSKLAQLGSITEPLLRKALQGANAEVRRRITALLQAWQDGKTASPDKRRELHAVTALERIASPSAIRLLQQLATGAGSDLTTRHSKATLEQLSKRIGH
jgi:hypothetical protein